MEGKQGMPNSVDKIIRRAMDEGQFNNLPGKGKPLQLDENPHEDAEWRTAYHILKSSGFTLPWIEALREIEAELESARTSLRQAWVWQRDSLIVADDPAWIKAEWQRAVDQFREEISSLNKRIADYNLQVPSDRFQRPRINPDQEIQAIQKNA
jgi:DnaJ family protein C protein 28